MHFAKRWGALASAGFVFVLSAAWAAAATEITTVQGPGQRVGLGSTSAITVTFNDYITVTGRPTIDVQIGSTTRQYTYYFAYPKQVEFRYAAQPGDNGTLTITGPINLNGGTIKGADGSDASLAFSPVSTSAVFDTVPPAAPVITAITPSSPTSDQTFSISGTAEPGGWVTLTLGPDFVAQPMVGADGTWSASLGPLRAATYTYTLQASDAAANKSPTMNVTVVVQPSSGPAAPVIKLVQTSGDGTYNARAQSVWINVVFSEAIKVTGQPTLSVMIGSTLVQIPGSQSGSLQLFFQFSPGNVPAQGALSVTGPINLNGGSVKAAVDGADAVLTFSPLTTNVIVDGIPPPRPVITGVTPSSPTSDQPFTISGTGEAGDRIDYRIGSTTSSTLVDASGNWTATVGPMAPGTYGFALNATDPAGNSYHYAGQLATEIEITVQPATPPASVPVVSNAGVSGQVGTAITPVPVSATNSPTSFSAPGLADYGLAISAAGVISGTPTAATSGADVPVTATNSAGTSSAATIHLTIAAAPVVPPPVVPPPVVPPPVVVPPVVTPPVVTPPAPGSQTITFSSPVSAVIVGQPITLGATSSAGLPISYTVVSGAATISGNVLTPTSAAPLVVRASSAGNSSYAAASVDVNFGTPQKAAQAITVATAGGDVIAGAPVPLNASSSSGLPVTYTVLSGPATISGNTLVFTGTGPVAVQVSQAGSGTYAAAQDVTVNYTAHPIARLVNVSSRVHLAAGDTAIAGFVVTGGAPKRILVRAVGDSLAGYGVNDPLANPRLTVYDTARTAVATNAGWGGDAQIAAASSAVGAFGLTAGKSDAALIATLAPGAYTAQVTSSSSGTVLVEVYDLGMNDAVPTKQLVNVSTRAQVDVSNAIVAGFVISGDQPKRVLVRAVGPALGRFGVGTAVVDTNVAIYSGRTLLAQNDDWGAPQPLVPSQSLGSSADMVVASAAAGAFSLPAGSKDAAILLTLDPGAYTAVARSGGSGSGDALVEVYEVP